jgi:hypothetical protein
MSKTNYLQAVISDLQRTAGPYTCAKQRGASFPHMKLTSDFANRSEAIRIGDCFSFDSFAKNSSACNFRLLQQYLPQADIRGGATAPRFVCQPPGPSVMM